MLPIIASILTLVYSSSRGDFTGTNLGSPSISGTIQTNDSGGLVVTAGGTSLGLRSDQGYFAWTTRPGDFDLVVRVESFAAPDVFGRAGLMARETLEADSAFAGVFATPSVAGILFQGRESSGSNGRQVGAFPANYPYAWLRLQRSGTSLTGSASGDGQIWTRLDSATLTSTNALYVGLAVTSWRTNEPATALFRDFGDGQGQLTAATSPEIELPGPSTRRTGLAISEIMYHPAPRSDGRDLEFVELFNSQSIFQDISGYRLSGALDFTFPSNTVLQAGGFLVVARVPNDVRAVYGITNVLGGYTNRLDNRSGVVRLRSRIGAVLLEATYDSTLPWPIAADGAGHSLVLAKPSFGERNVGAWAASRWKGGSPGRWDGYVHDSYSSVLINEVVAHPRPPGLDYVELYNHSNAAVDLSGVWLSDQPATNKYRIPDGTIMPARGFIAFDESVLGFGLSAEGEAVYLSTPDQSRVLDAVRFSGQAVGTAFGRLPDGAATWRTLERPTQGAANAAALRSDVVLNEIMFQPISGQNDDQYIELFNRSSSAIELSGWQFTSGIRFTFPSGTVLGSQGYLVVARNAARLLTNYPYLTAGTCLGDFQGSLSGSGESIVLSRPEVAGPSAGTVPPASKTNWMTVTEVTYKDGGRWGRWSDGGGSSLELTDPRSDPALAGNWADSDETAKGQWTTIEHTGVLDLGNSTYGPNQVQILLEDVGECLVDNIEVIGPAGTNMVTNGDFENGMTGWAPQGSHRASTLESGTGVDGSQCLHLRAESGGDTGANRIRGVVANGLKEGMTVTLRAKVRWLCGNPEFLIRLRGDYLEAFGRLAISARLGTPGLANSRALSNAPPAIYDVLHTPILPAANQPVVVTARLNDPDGIGACTLRYRIDPATEVLEVPMRDDGQEGDAVAGDGLYSATIPGQAAGVLVAFHVWAADGRPSPAAVTFPAAAPDQECLVRFGEIQPGSTFGTYRIWMTQAVRTRWTSREKLSNAPLDVTFVYGNQRVIYNAGALYAGSPFVSSGYTGPAGAVCGYVVRFPSDDRFLGITDLKLDWPVRDSTQQMEQVAYWIAEQLGLPSNRRRFVNLYVNGSHRGSIYEDAQQPNSDMVAQYFPDDTGGELYKIDDWFEFDNTAVSFVNTDATLQNFTTTNGEKKTARYRWNWRKHAVKDSANNYQSLFDLVDATQPDGSADYNQRVEKAMDFNEYFGVIALEHLVGNWDSFGFYRGKNMFTYKPKNGRWSLLTWDIDFVLSAQGYAADYDMFTTIDPTISQLMYTTYFRRQYERFFQAAVDGPLQPARFAPVLAANYNSLLANGVAASIPTAGSNYLAARAKYLSKQLAQVQAPFALTDTNTSASTGINLFYLQGSAPLELNQILVNGTQYPIQWIDDSHWQLQMLLQAATNHLELTGVDARGHPIAAGPLQFDVQFTGTLDVPQGHVVFNEIMYHSTLPGAEYVELFNNSSSTTFDVSGWRIAGLDFTFPAGTLMEPGRFFVLTRNRTSFASAYGQDATPFGEFAGTLPADGGTLRLIQPTATAPSQQIVAEVTYSPRPPWPEAANHGDIALQLRNPFANQDRVGNWSAVLPQVSSAWDFVSVTGPATSSRLLLYLAGLPPVRDLTTPEGAWEVRIGRPTGSSFFRFEIQPDNAAGWQGTYVYESSDGEGRYLIGPVGWTNNVLTVELMPGDYVFKTTLSADGWSMNGTYNIQGYTPMAAFLTRYNPGGETYLDDLCLNPGLLPDPTTNLLPNGGFEQPLDSTWMVSSNHLGTAVSTAEPHTGNASLEIIAAQGGVQATNAIAYDIPGLQLGATYTLSYWVRRSTNAAGFVARMEDWSLLSTHGLHPDRILPVSYTPGRPNQADTDLSPVPELWLNEFEAVNHRGPVDRFGNHGPWVEVANTSTNSQALAGFYLSDSFTNLAQWAFPTNAAMEPGTFLLVWLDGQPDKSNETEWHTAFQVPEINGTLVLSRLVGEQLQIVDYLQYGQLPADTSVGWVGDGFSVQREVMAQPTPLLANQAPPASPIFINEWMASNTNLVDPADSQFRDWFELFNPGPEPVDLSGYWLSDSDTNPGKFVVPSGTVLPAHGYLFIWADDQPQQNRTGGELHVNFKLNADGETILLSTPEGIQLDRVSFGLQQPGVSEGRWPDGAPSPFRRFSKPTPQAANDWTPELRLTSVAQGADGEITFRWASTSGQRFQVEYQDNLGDPAWIALPQLIAADPAETRATVSLSGQAHRFYRVVLVP